jgi:hypothetical protein
VPTARGHEPPRASIRDTNGGSRSDACAPSGPGCCPPTTATAPAVSATPDRATESSRTLTRKPAGRPPRRRARREIGPRWVMMESPSAGMVPPRLDIPEWRGEEPTAGRPECDRVEARTHSRSRATRPASRRRRGVGRARRPTGFSRLGRVPADLGRARRHPPARPGTREPRAGTASMPAPTASARGCGFPAARTGRRG